jgi:outer membrane protein TolC
MLSPLRSLCLLCAVVVSSGPVLAEVSEATTSDADALLLHLPEKVMVGLEPLIDAAKDVAPASISARLSALAAEQRLEQSRSVTRPRVDVFLDGSYRENSETQNGSVRPYYNIGLEQPLWHWHALDNYKHIAEINKRLADQDYAEARRSLVLEIRRQFLDLTLQRLSLAETTSSYERQRTTLGVNRDRSRRGEYAADLLATEQIAVRKAEVARDRQSTAFQRALREFALINGLESFAADRLPSEVPVVPVAAKALFQPSAASPSARNQIPAALARPESQLAISRLQQEITRVRTYPKLSFAMGADQGATSGTDQTAVVNYFAGLRVRWNIFDGFATRAATREARILVRQNENALAEARTALTRQLSDETEDLALSIRELDVAEESFSLTSSRLKVDEELWKSGRLAETDWQSRKALAETERIALYDLRGGTILKFSAHALSRQRAFKPSDEILFP